MKCPKCESDNTQRMEVAYHSGTQNFSTTGNSVGVGFSGGRMGLAGGVTRTSGQTQTTLAAACTPPMKKGERGPSAAFKLGLLFACLPILLPVMSSSANWGIALGVTIVGLLMFSPVWGTGLYILRSRRKYNKEVWPQLYRAWSESWICHKCGGVYQQK